MSDPVKIEELNPAQASSIKLNYSYLTDSYYDFERKIVESGWQFQLNLKKLDRPIEKSSNSTLFEPYVERAKVFQACINNRPIGYLQIGHETWNNRARVWDLLIFPEFRKQNAGTELIKLAVSEAKKWSARSLVLETQSCNTPAIRFYLKNGFEIIGFDSNHYSNEDIQKKEIRIEFGLNL